MEVLINRVKSLRTDISGVMVVIGAESLENGHNTADKAIDSCMDAFMFLGKLLGYLGDKSPYDENTKKISDFTDADYQVNPEESPITVVRALRKTIEGMLTNNLFNHLLDIGTDSGQPYVKFNDRQWFVTMTAFADLMKAKMWLGLYLNHLLNTETDEEKAIRLEVEAKEAEPKKEEAVVTGDRQATEDEAEKARVKLLEDENVIVYKEYLDARGVAYHKGLGYKKLKALFEAEQDVEKSELLADENKDLRPNGPGNGNGNSNTGDHDHSEGDGVPDDKQKKFEEGGQS